MRTKTLNLLFASVLAFVFLIAFTSATVTLSAPTELSQTPLTNSFTFTATSTVTETVSFSITDITYEGKTIVFSPISSLPLTATTPVTITVNYVIDAGFNFEFGEEFKTTLTATDSSSNAVTKTIPFKASDFCEFDNKGDLKVTVRSVDVLEGFGKDTDWYAFDNVEVSVRVENSGDEDLDNVVVEWGLYNTQSKEWTIELTEEDDFNLDSDEKEDLVFEFTIDDDLDESLSDLEEGDYIFYVKATGEITAGTYEGDNTCAGDSEEASLTVENDFVALYNFEVPESVQCDSEVQLSAEVWNIGSDDQEGVYVKVYNKELGIDKEVDIGDIDAFDSTDLNFAFVVPEDAEEKDYTLTFTAYDEDGDVYENSDDDKAISDFEITVNGGCAVAGASVDAVLESGGKAGRDMVVKATITNTGNKLASYSLTVSGYEAWASTVTLDNDALTLNAGESQEVLLTFDVNKDALGTQLFTLDLVSNTKLVSSQPVQVEITKKGFSLGNLFSGDSKAIWGIGLLNLILVVLIIVIAVRVSRK